MRSNTCWWAKAIEVGTANFLDPEASLKIIRGLTEFCKRKGIERLSSIVEQFDTTLRVWKISMDPGKRIIVALDIDSRTEACDWFASSKQSGPVQSRQPAVHRRRPAVGQGYIEMGERVFWISSSTISLIRWSMPPGG
jgi:hypothetical protein